MREVRIQVEWAPIAVEDLRGIYRYLRPRNHPAAKRLVRLILEAVDRLADHPELGPAATDLASDGRYRQLVVGVYRVVYRIDGPWVAVLRIWDGRRDPGELDLFDVG